MELKDLVGKKILDAVDFSNEGVKRDYDESYENCNVCRFRLDGVVYSAIEDPSDGYRSAMRELQIDEKAEVKNSFPSTEVVCRHRDEGRYDSDDVLEIIDTTTGKTILEVGTLSTDDYYPCYVANFDPTVMAINADT